jgi:protein-tyrosine-phosphatase
MRPGLERRARVHAALGEPVRLAIVELLALTDCSPGELAERFGLPSNLLAHHLRVLEAVELIRRTPSEGDGRRNYVQLGAAAPDVVRMGATGVEADRVVFVCTHNAARSQLAAAAWRRVSSIPSTSAGTHPAARVHPRAVATARRHGLRLAAARTRQVGGLLRPDDLVIAVCDRAHEELGAEAGLHWAVPDPARIDTDEAFESAYQQLVGRIDRLAAATPTRTGHPISAARQPFEEPPMTDAHKPAVLFLCVHNAGRSQMAMGFFTALAGDAAVAWSGGSEPGTAVNPAAVAAMAERGIDISREFPKPWTNEIVRAADVVVSMGCGDACPVFPGKRYQDWALEDPAGQDVAAVRPIRDEIERRVRALLSELGVPAPV